MANVVMQQFFALLLLLSAAAIVGAQPAGMPKLETWNPPELQTGAAKLVREYTAPEARQGVAVDER